MTDPSEVVAALIKDPDEVVKVLEALEKVNFVGAAEALRSGDPDRVLASVESFLGFLAIFVPQAQIGVYACMLLLFAEKTREAGLWRPGEEGDPAEAARDARDHRSGGK